jgi:hypothetical protein
MRRRIAVIMAAAAIAWSGPLGAQAPDSGERAPVGRSQTPAAPTPGVAPRIAPAPRPAPTPQTGPRTTPAPQTAPVEATAPVTRPPAVQAELVEKSVKDSIRSLDLQTELNAPETDKPDTRPTRIAPIKIPAEALWIALILAVALLLYSLREELMNLIRPAQTGWEAPAQGTGEVKIGSETDALSAADRLSREGNFVEAMHVLLLHSLAEIRRQLGEKFADSLTSREIVRVARLTAAARSALRDIVAAVERTYFGPYPAAAGDYATCRHNFETLQQALRGGATA